MLVNLFVVQTVVTVILSFQIYGLYLLRSYFYFPCLVLQSMLPVYISAIPSDAVPDRPDGIKQWIFVEVGISWSHGDHEGTGKALEVGWNSLCR